MDQSVLSAKCQIEQFKKDKYHFDPETGRCMLPEDAKSDYDNALKILSEQLYTKDIHFIFELIQNAEDNHYPQDVTPTLSFELLAYDPTHTAGCKGCLVVRNNESGFELSNIRAISSIGKSTKANQKDAGYIGEKGIGFKSVFVVSPAPHIISNGFQIKFLKDDPKTGLGYIVPYWLDSNFSEYTNGAGTTLLLPLQDGQGNQDSMFEKVRNELCKLSAELVLFLRKLKKVSIKTPSFYADYQLKKAGDYVELTVKSSLGESHSKYLLKSQSIAVPESSKNSLRENVTKRDISLAFPVDFELEGSPLYCYLPTESDTGLPFLVNADFILNASREAIRQDLVWNSWMREEVATFAASTLAEILSTKGEPSRWAWVPEQSIGSQHQSYWRVVGAKVIDALTQAACIPTLSGKYLFPSEALLLGQSFKFLKDWPKAILERLTKHLAYDEYGNITKISQKIGLLKFEKQHFLELMQALKTDDALTEEQLVDAWVEITSLSTGFSRGYKYRDNADALRSCLIFKCESGLQSAKYKNLYLPSSESHEVPILLNDKGESTKPNYIGRDFYSRIPEPVKAGIRLLFEIDEVHAVSYLEQSVYTFLKENQTACLPESLEAVSKYLISNIEDLPEKTVELLREVLPFKNTSGNWIFPKNYSRYVAPSPLFETPNWKLVYQSEDELQHIFELHEDYLNWEDEALAPIFLESFQIDEFVRPFVISHKGGVKFPATPVSFTKEDYWKEEANRLAALKWLYWVYDDEDRIVATQKNELDLGYFLLNHRWLLSTNDGLVKPSPLLHCFSESERSIFGSSLNYLKDSVTKVFAKKLGLITEPTPKGFMDQIKASKQNGDISEALLISAYESLSNWKDPGEAERIKRRLTQEQLIYLPELRNEWLSPQQATWEDKSDLGISFVGLSGYIPERLRYYFVDILGVKAFHGLASYLSAYQEVSALDEKLSSKNLLRLNIIVRQLIQMIRSNDFSADVVWNSFKAKCKICSDQGVWLEPNKAIFVADDGKTKELFTDDPAVHFTWSNSTEFYTFFEHIGVRKISEFIDVQIGHILNGKVSCEPQIAIPAKKAICFYIADRFDIDDEFVEKLSTFFHSIEWFCEQLTVKYTLAANHYVEVTTELGFYDDVGGSLILVENHDIADIKDELALSIARMFFGKKAAQHEKSLRVFIDIESENRLASVLKKEGLELDAEKRERLEAIFDSTKHADGLIVTEDNAVYEVQLSNHDDKVLTSGENYEQQEELNPVATLDEECDDLIENDGTCVVEIVEHHSDKFDDEGAAPVLTMRGTNNSDIPTKIDDAVLFDETINEHLSFNSERNDAAQPHVHPTSTSQTLLPKNGSGETPKRKVLSLEQKEESNGQSKAHVENVSDRPSNWNTSKSPRTSSSSVGYRLFSYVESEQTHERSEKVERDDINFGNKAELYVKQWLDKQGFKNIELLGGVNKGFDIQAVDPSTGELVFVEVKGQRGAWNRTGVALSKSQMEKCLEEGNSYWLVVVENLLSHPVIHKFVNPARLIDRYYFDANWAKIASLLQTAEPKEIDLDDLFFDGLTKSLYQQFQQYQLAMPEVCFEISNSQFEIIAELEFAWPELQIGIFLDKPKEQLDGWILYSAEEVVADINILIQAISKAQEG
ncbi:DUF3883 domain-containing protein [Rheinheimera mesophila]|uniref:DUF3883 domain-containing protein n=1 Tax=Rheinheimera mesophila TaxID=1547515 RepID=A0A3P3QSL1_9GAMM|nr:DUF3883 domain-containing protein [Rheinheimera mesophila]KKL00364.1 hypothetical protein SD53_15105 [Rheinheimera mesophila]RRJ23758.1 DUF3883 domain-containing protein [Rheinheimera mesophila]